MYAPVAEHLDVDRATAKVAVVWAMYGQTTGDGAGALRRLEAAYRVAMAYLAEAYRSGQAGPDLRTYGGLDGLTAGHAMLFVATISGLSAGTVVVALQR